MPTAEQVDNTIRHIADLADRRFVEVRDATCGCSYAPERGGAVGVTYSRSPPRGESFAFAELHSADKLDLLVTYVDWEGFSDRQAAVVIQNVIEGKEQKQWTEGVEFAGEMDAYASRRASATGPELER